MTIVHLNRTFSWVSNQQNSGLGAAALWNLKLRDECPESSVPLPCHTIFYLLILCFFPAEMSLVLTTNKQAAVAPTKACLGLSPYDEASSFLLILVLLISKKGRRYCLVDPHRCLFASGGRAWLFYFYDNYNGGHAHLSSILWNISICIITRALHGSLVRESGAGFIISIIFKRKELQGLLTE